MAKINDLIVNAASTIGSAAGAYQKAKDSMLKKPEFVQGLSSASQWSGGSLQNTEQAQLRAARNSWYYTGVNLKALDLSSSKIDIYNNPSGLEDEGEKAEGHPFLKVLRRPNPYMGKSLLMQYTEWWMDLQGEAFWFIEPDGSNGIKGIWPLPSNTMDIEFTPDGKNIERYVIKLQRWYYVDPNYVIHFKYPNPWDFFRGLPPLIAFMLTVDADLAMKTWNGAFFGKDNVMPSAVISLGSGDPANLFDQKDVDAVTEDLRNEYSAIKRKTVVTNANSMSVALLGYNSKDMDFLAGMGWNKEEILWAIGVPSGMVDKNSTEANAKVGNKIFKDNMWGIKGLIADEITSQLLQPFYADTLEARFEDDRIYNRDLELKEAALAKDAMTREAWAEKYFGVTLGPNDVTMSEGKAQQTAEMDAAKNAQPDKGSQPAKEKEIVKKPNAGTSNTIPGSNTTSKSMQEIILEDELTRLRTKAINYFKNGNIKSLKFQSEMIGKEMMQNILSDLHGAEIKSDIDVIIDYWQDFNKEGNIKGGSGSGENDGHPFRGNQWTDMDQKLTEDERKVVRRYTGGDFTWMNRHLRFGNKTSDSIKNKIAVLSSVIARSKLKEDVRLYRFMSGTPEQYGLQVGSTFEDKGFSSTSKKENYGYSQPMQFVINMKRGQSGLDVSLISGHEGEQEIILNPGSFKVISIEPKNNGGYRVFVDRME